MENTYPDAFYIPRRRVLDRALYFSTKKRSSLYKMIRGGEEQIKVQRCEQHKIKSDSDFGKFIDEYCFKSKNLYNYANYIIRQEFINNNNWIRYNKLFELVKESEPYKDLGSNVGQGTLRILDKNWKSFFKAIKDWSKNPSKYLADLNFQNINQKTEDLFCLLIVTKSN